MDYIEVLAGKPLKLKVDKYDLTFNLMTIKDFMYFNGTYKTILEQFNKLNDMVLSNDKIDALKVGYYLQLVNMIHNLVKSQYGFFKRRRLLKELRKIFLEDINKLIFVLDELLAYNTQVKKKLDSLQKYDIWGKDASWTIGGVPLSKYTRINEKGEKYLIPRYSLN